MMDREKERKKEVIDLPPPLIKRSNEIVPGRDPSYRSPFSRILTFFGK